MAENVQQSVEVPVALQIFGSLVTEMNAADLPEGISPDNQDVVFTPGAVSSRPGMRSWLSGLPVNTTITYQKTFTTPQGISLNLILTSDGQFWVQDTQPPDYLPRKLTDVTPGSYASSITAFGKELIVFHDNSQGTDVPRIYDGQYLDRVSQCGPGAPPSVANLIIPSSQMVLTDSGVPGGPGLPGGPVVIDTITTTNLTYDAGTRYYSALNVQLASGAVFLGQILNVTGNSEPSFNTDISVDVLTPEGFKSLGWYYPGPPATVGHGGGGVLLRSGVAAVRTNNIVTTTTATPHNLIPGFQVQISNVVDSPVGNGIASIVIDNESEPGIATITTYNPHGLSPQLLVNILDVSSVSVGGGISTISRSGQVVTVVTTATHGLSAGSIINIAGTSDTTFIGQFVVQSVPDTTSFTYSQVDVDAVSTGGTVKMSWIPTEGGLFQNLFTVVSCPTPTSFQVSVSYANGTWTTGRVTFAWNGIFFVTAVISDVSFQYRQLGPNISTNSLGTVTPHSQISPGIHQYVMMFKTRQGYVTAPSPPGQVIANGGGEYLQITDMASGPDNVVERIVAFTGADGNNFFYIPVPAFVNGITVSTSTTIPNNFTSNLLVDFSDNTLFDSIAIDIKGNNLFELAVLGPCLGVDSYASRSAWFGMNNDVPNFLNLGFEGGYLTPSGTPDYAHPLGWNIDETSSGSASLNTNLVEYGMGWRITGSGTGIDGMITQSAYKDAYNINIINPSTRYTVRFRFIPVVIALGDTGILKIEFYSPTVGTLSEATFFIASTPSNFITGEFGLLPDTIPSDTLLRIYGDGMSSGSIIVLDEFEFWPTLIPTVPKFLFSYINSPESLDMISGVLGATDDVTPIMSSFLYRDAFLFLTGTKLHETNDIVGYEPDEWRIRQISENCGACSPRCCSSGENFSVWVTSPSSYPPVGRGLYIYTGGSVYKLSQEIQPDFDSINRNAQNSIWVQNDAVTRRIYVGVPIDTATAPNRIYVLDYREMDSAAQIAEKPPIHISFSGKMIASDLSRKWTRWNIPTNSGNILYIPGVGLEFCVAGGNGMAPRTADGVPNSYWFDPSHHVDDYYGVIDSYYTTYFFINHEMEASMQVGLHRKLYKRYAIYIEGIGQTRIIPYANTLSNPWPSPPQLPLTVGQKFDLGDGLNVSTERCAFRIGSTPPAVAGTDSPPETSFSLSKFIVTLCQEPVSPIRFGAV